MSIASPPHDQNLESSTIQWFERVRQELNRPRRPLFISVKDFNSGPVLTQINSLGIYGARVNAVGDSFKHLFYVPKDFNVNTNIKFEVEWCTNNAVLTNTATWKILFSAMKDGEALSAAATELNSVITADNVLGAYIRAVSPYGLIYKDLLEHGDLVHLNVSLGSVSGLDPTTDIVFLLGISINDEG